MPMMRQDCLWQAWITREGGSPFESFCLMGELPGCHFQPLQSWLARQEGRLSYPGHPSRYTLSNTPFCSLLNQLSSPRVLCPFASLLLPSLAACSPSWQKSTKQTRDTTRHGYAGCFLQCLLWMTTCFILEGCIRCMEEPQVHLLPCT